MSSASTTIAVLTMVAIVVTHAVTLSDRFKKSPCQLSDRQMEIYDTCVRMIYGNRQLTFEEFGTDMHYRRIIPCAWSKFGVFGAKGFDIDVMKAEILEMPVDEQLKNRLIESTEKCSNEEGSYNIMTCIGDKKKQICKLDAPTS